MHLKIFGVILQWFALAFCFMLQLGQVNSTQNVVKQKLQSLDELVQKKEDLMASLKITLKGEDKILLQNTIQLSLLKDTIDHINEIRVTDKIAWSKVIKELGDVMNIGELTVSTVKHRINNVRTFMETAEKNGVSTEKLMLMAESDIKAMMQEFKLKRKQISGEIAIMRSAQYQEQIKAQQLETKMEKLKTQKDKIVANIISNDREDQEERDLAYESAWVSQHLSNLGDTLDSLKDSVGKKHQPVVNDAISQVKAVEQRYGQVAEFLPLSVSAKTDAKKIVSAESSKAASVAADVDNEKQDSVSLGVTFRRTTAKIFQSLLGHGSNENENDNPASGLDLSTNSPLRKSKPGPKPKNQCSNCKTPTAKRRLVQGLCQTCVVEFRREKARREALKNAGIQDDGSQDLTILDEDELDGADGGNQDDGSDCMINNDSDSDEAEDQDETVEI